MAYVGLGANLGDPLAALRDAVAQLRVAPGVLACDVSPVYRSAPVDAQGPDFHNAVARLVTTLSPPQLLDVLQAIEQAHGRQRPYRNAPRTLDLDLLLHGDATWCDDRLVVPHPRMHLRAFVLRPLLDLDPQCGIPGLGPAAHRVGATAGQVIERLPDPL